MRRWLDRGIYDYTLKSGNPMPTDLVGIFQSDLPRDCHHNASKASSMRSSTSSYCGYLDIIDLISPVRSLVCAKAINTNDYGEDSYRLTCGNAPLMSTKPTYVFFQTSCLLVRGFFKPRYCCSEVDRSEGSTQLRIIRSNSTAEPFPPEKPIKTFLPCSKVTYEVRPRL